MKKIIYCIFFIFFPNFIFGQASNLENAIKFFESKNYTACLLELQECTPSIEKSFYELLSKLYLNKNIKEEIDLFLEQNQNHILTQDLAYQTGNFFYQQMDFKNAAYFFSKGYRMPIYTQTELQTAFKLAYSYFMLNRYDQARKIFDYLKNGQHSYKSAAAYYAAYIAFLNDEHENLIIDLKKAEKDSFFSKSVREFLPTVYFRLGQNEHIIKFLDESIHIKRLLGECYLLDQNYEEAIKYLEIYWTENKNVDDNLLFKMGFCYGKLNNFDKAISFLEQVSEQNPETYQNAMYHLGFYALQKNDKYMAAIALEKASQFNINTYIQEEALYNAIKAHFEVQNFHKSIVLSEQYLTNFLQGKYQTLIQEVLGEAYLYTQNYEEAIRYLDNLTKTPKIKYAYQRLFFNRGVELFYDKKYQQAILILKNALEYRMEKELTEETLFLIAESYNQLKESKQAIKYYLEIPETSLFYKKSYYGLGYAYFQVNDLRKAINYFHEFIQGKQDLHNRSDVFTKLADCYFLQKNYEKALSFYDSALLNGVLDVTYIDFQKALILKQTKKYTNALIALSQIENYNLKNLYGLYAKYYKGLIYEEIEQNKAQETYKQLIDSFPEHEIRAFARQRLAEIYAKNSQKSEAEAELKLICQEFRGTDLAFEAYQKIGLLRGETLTASSKENNEMLEKGINFFEKRNYDEASKILESFLKSNPKNQDANEAFYFLAESYANMGNFTAAVLYYEKVQGIRKVEASLKAAEIELEKQNFPKAEKKFQRILESSLDKKILNSAKKGLIVSQFKQKKLEKLTTSPSEDADLVIGKNLVEQKKLEEALGHFRSIARHHAGEKAAEAQYWIGKILRNEKHLESSNLELQELARKFASYPNWVEEAYWLMVENYLDLGNKFQAKTILKELTRSKNPVVSQMANVRLGKL